MKKRILLGMCVILTAAFVYAMGGSEEAAAVAKADKQLTIHMVFNGMVFDGNWDIYRLAAAKTGVMLKGTASKNNTDAKQAFNLMVASGSLPDIISYTQSDLETLGLKDGAVIDLTDLINKHAPNIKRFMKENPRFAKDMYAYDGKIYALPTYFDSDKLNVTTTLFIRTDWLKKFNLKVPTTVEELEHVLTVIVNGDANGNGKKDEVGLFARGTGTQTPLLYTAGILGARYATSFYVENGKLNYNPLEPTFKPAIATLADWYKKVWLIKNCSPVAGVPGISFYRLTSVQQPLIGLHQPPVTTSAMTLPPVLNLQQYRRCMTLPVRFLHAV